MTPVFAPKNRIWILILAACIPAASPAPSPALPAPPVEATPPHVIIVSLDATRPDHLSLYGYPLPTTPNLDRFAARAVVFEDARTVVPLTGPSHASLFTSRYPHAHGAFRNGIPLKDTQASLPAHLRRHGYETAAFVSGWTLRGALSGLDRAFDVYDDRIPNRYKVVNRERYAAETVAAVRTHLESRAPTDRPLFLFVHFFDPHDPYRKDPESHPLLQRAAADLYSPLPARHCPKTLAYDSEISAVDRQLGVLFHLLEQKGILQDSVTVILADHGESLGEHGYWGHGRRVYDTILRVPLVLLAAREGHGHRRVRQPVSTLDLMPTILALTGLPPPPEDRMEGADLSPLLQAGGALPGRRIYFETFPGTVKRFTKHLFRKVPDSPLLMGFVEDGRKYILRPESSTLEIYDLLHDPREERNLASVEEPHAVAVSHLEAWYSGGRHAGSVRTRLSRDDIRQMKSLGYID